MVPISRPGRCPGCFLKPARCLCHEPVVQQSRVHVAIVRHALERKKISNSGRLAAMTLSNVALHTYGAQDRKLDRAALCRPGTWLLFPGSPIATPDALATVRSLVVLDGNWNQARRMRRHIPGLRALPVLSLPAPEMPRLRLRNPPRMGAMATIEAIAAALRLLGDGAAARELERVYDIAVQRALSTTRRQRD